MVRMELASGNVNASSFNSADRTLTKVENETGISVLFPLQFADLDLIGG